MPITAGRSTTSSIGFVGDSAQTSAAPGTVASSAAGVSSGTAASSSRPSAARSRSCSATPKYGARCATTRTPAASSSRIALLAASPVENATQLPPSSSPSACSNAAQPGLPSRP
jgi:hypothetical protein